MIDAWDWDVYNDSSSTSSYFGSFKKWVLDEFDFY